MAGLRLWLLLLGSLGLAVANLLRDPKQRTGAHVWLWLARLLIGAMWWQQTLWQLPPSFDGLHYWLDQMAQHAAFAWQRAFVQQIVQPHFTLFAAMVYAMEVGIAVSLMLGFITRLGGVLGALQALNLWTGLYGSPEEWTWTFFSWWSSRSRLRSSTPAKAGLHAIWPIGTTQPRLQRPARG